MKQLVPILVVCILVLLTSCNTTGEDYTPTAVTYVDFSYVNEDGKDLLDEDTIQFFNIYYLQQNEETGEFERQEARSPQYSFYRHSASRLITLRLFPNPDYIENTSTTLIESPRDIIDTLRVQVHQEGQGISPEVVWYNGEKIWETGPNPPDLYFKITKSSF